MSSTGYTVEYITNKLKDSLETTHLEVKDISDGCGAKFNVLIVSPKFDGIQLLQRHRMVNQVLENELKSIHAFSMRTLTPQQYSQLNEN